MRVERPPSALEKQFKRIMAEVSTFTSHYLAAQAMPTTGTCLRRISSAALWRATARWTCTTPSVPTETKTSAMTQRANSRPRSHTASGLLFGAYCSRVKLSAAPPTAAMPLQTPFLATRRRTTTRVAAAAAAAAADATAASRVGLLASKLQRRSEKTTSRWTLKSRTVLRPAAS